MGTVKLVRNPYPIPELSREGKWIPKGPELVENVTSNTRRWYAKLDPHERLFSHHTLNSARKNTRYYYKSSSEVPKDSLDYMLSSVYEHNDDLFVPKMYVMMQPETLNKETWRVLRNQIKIYSKPPVPLGHEMKYAQSHDKEDSGGQGRVRTKIHPSSLQLAIEGPHTDRTNPGFSRKIDGTYYGI